MTTNPSETPKRKVLFLCTGNSCRSQMAEAISQHICSVSWTAVSAGTQPADYVHPLSLQVLEEIGIHHLGEPKSLTQFANQNFDLVVTVCDQARESCPLWLGGGDQVHVGFPDPALAEGSAEEIITTFRDLRNQILEIIPRLLITYTKRETPDEY